MSRYIQLAPPSRPTGCGGADSTTGSVGSRGGYTRAGRWKLIRDIASPSSRGRGSADGSVVEGRGRRRRAADASGRPVLNTSERSAPLSRIGSVWRKPAVGGHRPHPVRFAGRVVEQRGEALGDPGHPLGAPGGELSDRVVHRLADQRAEGLGVVRIDDRK